MEERVRFLLFLFENFRSINITIYLYFSDSFDLMCEIKRKKKPREKLVGTRGKAKRTLCSVIYFVVNCVQFHGGFEVAPLPIEFKHCTFGVVVVFEETEKR